MAPERLIEQRAIAAGELFIVGHGTQPDNP